MSAVFLLERNPLLQNLLESRLQAEKVPVEVFVDLDDLIKALERSSPRLVILSLESLGFRDKEACRKRVQEFIQSRSMQARPKRPSVFLLVESFDPAESQCWKDLGVQKIFDLPLKLDELLLAAAVELGTTFDIDQTPSVIEAHLNDDVLYIEVALGFNQEKLLLLRIRIRELLSLYGIRNPKVILLLPDFDPSRPAFSPTRLVSLLEDLLEVVGGRVGWIKVVGSEEAVRALIATHVRLAEVECLPTVEAALDSLMISTDRDLFNERLLQAAAAKAGDISLRLKFDPAAVRLRNVAVVDDDFIVQEIVKNTLAELPVVVHTFDDGQSFLNSLDTPFDLIFLDLIMPGLTGFDVLAKLRQQGRKIPVIILSALGRRETVLKAIEFGVRSYLIKPIKPAEIVRKLKEVLEFTV